MKILRWIILLVLALAMAFGMFMASGGTGYDGGLVATPRVPRVQPTAAPAQPSATPGETSARPAFAVGAG